MQARGFITQASYRVITERDGSRRPVVYLYGRLEDDATFLVRDDRQRPHFYIRAADLTRAQAMGAPTVVSVDRRTFDGAPVVRLEVDVPGDVPAVRERLHAAGIETFEADVRFAVRYLIERRIKAGCLIEGEATASEAVSWVFVNPTLRPADVSAGGADLPALRRPQPAPCRSGGRACCRRPISATGRRAPAP